MRVHQNQFVVLYKDYSADEPHKEIVNATDKWDAYSQVVEKYNPYSAWVESVTYNNGNEHHFNTFEGKPV